LEQTRVLQAALQTQKQQVILREYAGGHSYAVWNIALQDALLTYLPATP
jgi:enterochelin esterase-like enzyme